MVLIDTEVGLNARQFLAVIVTVHYKKITPMKRIETFWLVPTFLLLSMGMFGQDTKSDILTYSFSYIPPYLTSYNGEFSFRTIPINFEANIHYKPGDRISFTTGLGYCIKAESHYVNWTTPDEYFFEETVSNIRLPIQFNYHIIKSPDKTDCYLKAVFTNGVFSRKVRKFHNYEQTDKRKSYSYIPSAGVGIGSIFFKNRTVGLIVEGTVEKYITSDSYVNRIFSPLKNSTWYSLKIGIVV